VVITVAAAGNSLPDGMPGVLGESAPGWAHPVRRRQPYRGLRRRRGGERWRPAERGQPELDGGKQRQRAFEVARRGQHTFEGGLAGLQALLFNRLETFGADRRDRMTPVEVVVKRGRVAGVRVRPRDETIGNEFVVLSGSGGGAAVAADALADANNAWWTVGAWQGRQPMLAFTGNEPHRSIMTRLDHYCDEATFVDWEQGSADLPDWQTSWRHLTADGTAAKLTQPSDANETRAFPPPVEPAGGGT